MGIDPKNLKGEFKKKVEAELAKNKNGITKIPENPISPSALVQFYNREKWFHVEPMGKPRMTKSDKWKKRPVVQRYWAFKDEINLQKGDFELPLFNYWIIFYIPMAKSWPKYKKRNHIGKLHQQQKPDKDNLEKAFLDALLDEDHGVADGRVSKIWAPTGEGKIQVRWFEPE